jgi:WD40 repeat protein
MRRSE